MPANCTTCNSPATLGCGGCADHRPSNAKVWYCSQPCQKAHWEVHRRACKLAQSYTQIKDLHVPADTETIVRVFHQVGGMTPQQGGLMMDYLARVPLAARGTTVGAGGVRLRADINAALYSLKRMTASEYQTRYRHLPAELRQKGSEKTTAHEVPFDQRPCVEADVHGNARPGIEVYPQDYESLDAETFWRMYEKGPFIHDAFARAEATDQVAGECKAESVRFKSGNPFEEDWVDPGEAAARGLVEMGRRRKALLNGKTVDTLLDNGYLPHPLIRIGIRRLLAQRLREIASTSVEKAYENKMKYVDLLRTRPIAIETAKANEQHYEVGTGVLDGMLGPRMKYSCCWYDDPKTTLGEAEEKMMQIYIERAGLKDGMKVLDLGCGWGSLSLFLAEKFPNSSITAFSNSRTQKAHIDSEAQRKSLTNLEVITGDVVHYTFPPNTYDAVLSIELFEHMKNYELLMAKVAHALVPGGKLFVHIFAHRDTPYDFEEGWMTEYFFTGGTMPSADLLHFFQGDLSLKRQWWVNGMHYARTCEDWLKLQIKNKQAIWPHLVETYGQEKAGTWYYRWEVFYMACAELFAYEGGDTWGVCHYLFEKPVR